MRPDHSFFSAIQDDTIGADVLGHDFGSQTVDRLPTIPVQTAADLGDVADSTFWEPFGL
jgi:hypothetical protein